MIYLIDFCGFPWSILPWLLSGFLGFLMGYFWMRKWMAQFQEMEGKYNALRKKYTQLESDLSDCKSARATLEGDLATAQGVVKETEVKYANLMTSNDKVLADLTSANGLVKAADDKYAQLKAAHDKAVADLEAANRNVKDAEGKYAQMTSARDKVQADLDKCLASKKSTSNAGNAAAGFAAGAATSSFASKPVEKAPEPKAQAPKPAAPKATGPYAGLKSDNLQIIEGIGPKMESVLHAAGVKTWSDLAGKSHNELRAILDSHGDKYKIINPSTWAQQASFAANGKWEGLIDLQKNIDGAAGTMTAGGSDSKLEKIIGKTQKAGFSKYKQDDLKIVEGIGPKIAGLLVDGGITTWAKLSETPTSKIQEILDAAGPRYKLANPGSWPRQAGLAAAGKWEELKKLQDELDGGK